MKYKNAPESCTAIKEIRFEIEDEVLIYARFISACDRTISFSFVRKMKCEPSTRKYLQHIVYCSQKELERAKSAPSPLILQIGKQNIPLNN